MDWEIYCSEEYKLPTVSSIYFIGAMVGLLCGSVVFDNIGRKRGASVGAVLCILATFAGVFCQHYALLLGIRFVMGFSSFITITGSYVWCLEFAPRQYRNLYNSYLECLWVAGYVVISITSYSIQDWNYIFLAVVVLGVICLPPFVIFPESPRFYLIKGRNDEAKKVLMLFSTLGNNPKYLDGVDLENDERTQSIISQLKDFVKYPAMALETVILMFAWFVVALAYYGFNFSWSKISNDLYASYLYAALGELIAYTILLVPLTRFLGRKWAMIFFLLGGAGSYVIAMIDFRFGGEWSLERLACLVGTMFISGAFALVYLYTMEVAPTTHRGMIMCLSSSSARIASFLGPYVSLLFDMVNRRVPLLMFAVLGLLAALGVYFLPDTSSGEVPDTPEDVKTRRNKFTSFSDILSNGNAAGQSTD